MLIQTDPFRDLDTLLNRFAGRSANAAGGAAPVDAFRRGTDVWVHMDLPGVKAEDLDITVEHNVLTIEGERDWQRQEGDQPYFGERFRGSFRRQIQLGDSLDLEHLEADLMDGVLTIRIPGGRAGQGAQGPGRPAAQQLPDRDRDQLLAVRVSATVRR